jgi:hypothetical protein
MLFLQSSVIRFSVVTGLPPGILSSRNREFKEVAEGDCFIASRWRLKPPLLLAPEQEDSRYCLMQSDLPQSQDHSVADFS